MRFMEYWATFGLSGYSSVHYRPNLVPHKPDVKRTSRIEHHKNSPNKKIIRAVAIASNTKQNDGITLRRGGVFGTWSYPCCKRKTCF